MEIPTTYAYLFWALFFGVFWAIFYIAKPSVRKEMLILSVLMGILGPFAEFFATHHYYHPETVWGTRIGFEDFLIGFFYGGVGAVIYEMFLYNRPNYSSRPGNPLAAFIALVFAFLAMYIGAFVFPWATIYVLLITMIFVGLSMAFYRKNLLKHAVGSGVLFTLFTFAFFQIFILVFPGIIEKWWELDSLSGRLIGGVPLEEILFAFAWGFVLGPASELVARMDFKKLLNPASWGRL